MTLTHSDKPSMDDVFSDIILHTRVNCNDVAAFKKFKLITFTRDLTAASGLVNYTGVGFPVGAVVFFAVEPTLGIISTGMFSINATGVNDYCTYAQGDGSKTYGAGTSIVLYGTALNSYTSVRVSSIVADGFSMFWTRSNSVAGTATIIALCIR